MLDPAAEKLFAGPGTREVYTRLLATAGTLGPYEVEVKKTCVHLARKTAFAGVHPRKGAVLVTLKAAQPIDSPRVRKVDRMSAQRFYCDLLLTSPAEIDTEFVAWLGAAYQLTG